VLLALLLAASSQKPPAHLVVPRSMRKERDQEEQFSSFPPLADPRLAEALGPLEPHAGAWAEYLVRTKGEDDVRLRASILSVLGAGRYWLEMATASESGPPAATKLLVKGNPAQPRDLERALLLVAGQQPLEIPLDQLETPDLKSGKLPKVERLKPARVRVRAGEFLDAEALRVGDTRIWRSGKVPLWGLVKVQSPSQTVELLSYGLTGAHTVFPPGWGDEPAQGKGSESVK